MHYFNYRGRTNSWTQKRGGACHLNGIQTVSPSCFPSEGNLCYDTSDSVKILLTSHEWIHILFFFPLSPRFSNEPGPTHILYVSMFAQPSERSAALIGLAAAMGSGGGSANNHT